MMAISACKTMGPFLRLKHISSLDTIACNQVYFHKVNQLTQEYLVRALSRARELANQGKLTLSEPLQNMLCNGELTVPQYVRLTDADINSAMMDWADNEEAIFYRDMLADWSPEGITTSRLESVS